MLIRHDEQLKALPDLTAAVSALKTVIAVNAAKVAFIGTVAGVIGSIVSCVGTWIVIAHFSK